MDAVYSGGEIEAVAYVAAVYFNPKRKKEDEDKRQGKKKQVMEDKNEGYMDRELPEESTVSYYV